MMTRHMTLGRALVDLDALWIKLAAVGAGSLLVVLAAQVSVQIGPVPLSMQTLAVLMVGFVLGSRLGASALALYLAYGAAGLPVFAGGKAGLAWLFAGPTTGFLFGFVLMAAIAGLAADRGIRGIAGLTLTGLVAAVALYIPGVLWPMSVAGLFGLDAGWVGLDAAALWSGWVSPFIAGDVIKAVLAALLVAGGWSLLKR